MPRKYHSSCVGSEYVGVLSSGEGHVSRALEGMQRPNHCKEVVFRPDGVCEVSIHPPNKRQAASGLDMSRCCRRAKVRCVTPTHVETQRLQWEVAWTRQPVQGLNTAGIYPMSCIGCVFVVALP